MTLSIEKIVEDLQAKARNCRNNAEAEQAVINRFQAEYRAGLSDGIIQSGLEGEKAALAHRHMRELYDFYVGGQHRQRDFLRDAELFESTVALMTRY